MLRISHAADTAIRAHAVEGYPDEICGLLVGEINGDCRTAWEAHPVPNRWNDDPTSREALLVALEQPDGAQAADWESADARRRFIIDPRDQLAVFRAARKSGMDLVGVYHTHPEHPAIPSRYDRAAAMAGWSYVIVSVRGGEVAEFRSWEIECELGDEGDFIEEAIAEE